MKCKGFTIIELLVAITIIGILTAAAGLKFSQARSTGRDAQRISDILTISKGIEQGAVQSGGKYPGDLLATSPSPTVKYLTSVMCAVNINDFSLSAKVDTSAFKNGIIPIDPKPAYPSTIMPDNKTPIIGNCVFPSYGYIYHSHYTASQFPAIAHPLWSQAYQLHDKYVLEVALEQEQPPGGPLVAYTDSEINNTSDTSSRVPPTSDVVTGQNHPAFVPGYHWYYFPGPYCGTQCYN